MIDIFVWILVGLISLSILSSAIQQRRRRRMYESFDNMINTVKYKIIGLGTEDNID